MTLTDYLTDEEIGEIAGKPFGIEPKSRYDKEEFIERTGDLFSVRELSAMLRENSGNIGVLNRLIETIVNYMPGDKRENVFLLQQNPYLALEQGELLYSAGVDSMIEFIRNNRNEILGKLSTEEFYSLIRKVPLVKANEGPLDEIVDSDDEILRSVLLSYAVENKAENEEYGRLGELALDVNERTKNLQKYKENPEGSKGFVAGLAKDLRVHYKDTYEDKDLLEVLNSMAEGVAMIKYNVDYVERKKELESVFNDYVMTLGKDKLIEIYTGLLKRSRQSAKQDYVYGQAA